MKNLILAVFLLLGLQAHATAEESVYTFDNFGRLTSCPAKFEGACPGKQEVACPAQTPQTGVILAIGQSNAANSAAQRMVTQYPDRVVNYFDGKCFVASSPLLGSGGPEGEFITPLADDLVANGTYKSVIILAAAIPQTDISRWKAGADLNGMMLQTITGLQGRYKITDIVWHQGEGDKFLGTSREVYVESFNSMLQSIRDAGVAAPIFIAVASFCGTSAAWMPDNPVTQAQKSLIDPKRKVYLGANTDLLLDIKDRRPQDNCHFSESGQRKTASAFAAAIKRVHTGR